jgi:hypothetical protein
MYVRTSSNCNLWNMTSFELESPQTANPKIMTKFNCALILLVIMLDKIFDHCDDIKKKKADLDFGGTYRFEIFGLVNHLSDILIIIIYIIKHHCKLLSLYLRHCQRNVQIIETCTEYDKPYSHVVYFLSKIAKN